MAGYIVRRILGMLLLLVLVSASVFALYSLLPADPARLTCGKSCTPEVVEANRRHLGLDKPVTVQYLDFVKGLVVGRVYSPESPEPIVCEAPCLGYSYRRQGEVLALIVKALPVTFSLALGALVLWLLAGISLGIFAALNQGRWQDRAVMAFSMLGYSLPAFFLGLLAIFFIVLRFKLLPFPSFVSPLENPVRWLQTMILPWIVLAILYAAYYVRLTRTQVLEVLNDDFVRTARAKGLPERTVIVRHALRAGIAPIVTSAGLDFAGLLGGAVITEGVFSLPGIGSLVVSSATDADLPLLVGITLFAATIVIVANLVVDLLYAVIDPRVRLA